MSARSFAEYLSGLDEASLTAVLQARPDVRVQPVPRGFGQLAQRLGGADSLVNALRTVNRDMVVLGQAIVALGAFATMPNLARLLVPRNRRYAPEWPCCASGGLAWDSGRVLCLPERLEAHWVAEIGGCRPVVKIAGSVLADDLRAAVGAFGAATDGLRKPELLRHRRRHLDHRDLAHPVSQQAAFQPTRPYRPVQST
ncbi:MAG: hypothetical protein ACRDST_07185 [Pseudonocardiaceae bacterium]